MPDKTKSKVVIGKKEVNTSKKDKESKTDYFIRIATPRVSSILKRIRILGNCSSRNNYEYTQEQVDSMYEKLQEALDTMILKFTPSKKEQEAFKF